MLFSQLGEDPIKLEREPILFGRPFGDPFALPHQDPLNAPMFIPPPNLFENPGLGGDPDFDRIDF
jgi:hypothetical protein